VLQGLLMYFVLRIAGWSTSRAAAWLRSQRAAEEELEGVLGCRTVFCRPCGLLAALASSL